MAAKKKTEKKVKLVALTGFGWGKSWWNTGDYLTVGEKRADFLITNGLATLKN